jgi:outer membrane protein TolC
MLRPQPVIRWLATLLFTLGVVASGTAQQTGPRDTISISLQQAVQIAQEHNYALRNNQLDVQDADLQVDQTWGRVMPQVSFSSSYQRNLRTSNPFAGSSAGNIFGSLGSVDWLQYNERARSDDDPSTEPISLEEFQRRRQQGYAEAGHRPGGGNPFGVDNQFQGGINISQTLYNKQAFNAISGAEQMRAVNREGLHRTRQEVTHDVRTAYFDVLLAQERAAVMRESVRRITRTVEETRQRVERGTASKYQRLNSQVQQSNLETELIESENQVESAKNRLKHVLGLPVTRPIKLQGSLQLNQFPSSDQFSASEVTSRALEQRPELERARLAVELEKVPRNIEESTFVPAINFFANLDYSGRVPDNRTNLVEHPDDPFTVSAEHTSFFSQNYWNPSVAVGVQVSWTVFDGLQRKRRIQQAEVSIQRAELQQEQLRQSVHLEIEQALQDLRAARQRIASQEKNLERAQLNYEFAVNRLDEGVGSPLEERDASEQLDQSRLSYLQAVRDYLVARSAFELATGEISPSSLSLPPANDE